MRVGCGLDIGSKELKLHYYKISQYKDENTCDY